MGDDGPRSRIPSGGAVSVAMHGTCPQLAARRPRALSFIIVIYKHLFMANKEHAGEPVSGHGGPAAKPPREQYLWEHSPLLWDYLDKLRWTTLPGGAPQQGEYPQGHLKVMATVDDGEGHIQWAIFFGNKNSRRSGDEDLQHASVKSYGDAQRMEWQNGRPLWLVPISKAARDEALAKLDDGATPYVPAISCSSITIRNAGRHSGSWDYDFWYADSDAERWNADPRLTLGPQGFLKTLSASGQWFRIQIADDTPWPVWVTVKSFPQDETLISFPAPQCLIADDRGKYPHPDLWFGVQVTGGSGPDQLSGDRPYVALGTGNGSPPLYWDQRRRVDDVIDPGVSDGLEKVGIDGWKDVRQVFKVHEQDHAGEYVKQLLGDFGKAQPLSFSRQWIIREQEVDEAGKARTFFHVAYFRVCQLNEADGRLYKLIGREGTQKQILRFTQIARQGHSFIFSSIRFVSKRELQDQWNAVMAQVRAGLLQVTRGYPVGLAPELDRFSGTSYHAVSQWSAPPDISCTDATYAFDLIASRFFSSGSAGPEKIDIRLPLLRQEKYQPNPMPGQEGDNDLHIAEARLGFDTDAASSNDNGTLLQFTLKSCALEKDAVQIRDGGMGFTIGHPAIPPEESALPRHGYGRLRLLLQLTTARRPLFLWQWFPGLDARDHIGLFYAIEDFSLPVQKVAAAGQDPVAIDRLLAPSGLGAVSEGYGERLEAPLVIPLESGTGGQYLLTMSESVQAGQHYRIQMQLQEFNPLANVDSSTSVRAVVLDAHPQITGLVQARFMQQPGYDDGAWVLARRSPFSEEGGGWELLDDRSSAEGFHLVLPAQAIGEAYVKGRHNHPVPIPEGEPEADEPVDYRFGAPARLTLSSGRLERRYVTLPWSLRRIWGQAGDAAPGVPFLDAQVELLYGLNAVLKPPEAFIAELGAKLGEFPVPPAGSMVWQPTTVQQAHFQDSWTGYLQFYRAWKSRLGILEPSQGDAFGQAGFDSHISFRPRIELTASADGIDELFEGLSTYIQEAYPGVSEERRKALNDQVNAYIAAVKAGRDLQEAFAVKEAILSFLKNQGDTEYYPKIAAFSPFTRRGASLRYPIAPGADDAQDALDEKIRAAHDSRGLAGGFHYGFEARAIYREFWREAFARGSSSGELVAPAFSSVGGWGKQTARFAADKTVIKATVGMGRTHAYAVERIGRIGVFWNKAKHVIEYERTVAPSTQFKGDQPPHLGRPLVRKVREYVEILEPVRAYPDFATDPQDAPGSVTACTFKTTIIPVLSAWGHDVYAPGEQGPEIIGWEVPLWRPGADPGIYPKPQVVLSVLAAPDADEDTIPQNMSEPQHLWFYTDTRESAMVNGVRVDITADVHAWPSVQEVDYTLLPEPEQYNIEPAAGNSPDLINQPLPGALDVLPGFERFTFRVDRNEEPASVAGRHYPAAPLTGRMRTVSMMRSLPDGQALQWWTAADQDLAKVKTALEKLVRGPDSLLARAANGFTDIEQQIRSGTFRDLGKGRVYRDRIKALFSPSSPDPANLYQAIRDIAATPVKPPQLQQFGALWAYSKDLEVPLQWLWREILENADGFINKTLAWYETQAQLLLSEVDQQLQQLALSGRQFSDELIDCLQAAESRMLDMQGNLEIGAEGLSDTLLKALTFSLGKISGLADDAFARVIAQVEGLDPSKDVDAVRADLNKIMAAEDAKLRAHIAAVFRRLRNLGDDTDIDAIMNVAVEAIATWKRAVESVVGEEAADARELISRVKAAIYHHALPVSDALRSALSRMETVARSTASSWGTRLHDFAAGLKEIMQGYGDTLSQALEQIRQQWEQGGRITREGLATGLQDLKGNLASLLRDKIGPVLYQAPPATSVFSVLTEINASISGLEQIIKSSLLKVFGATNLENSIDDWLETVGSFQDLVAAIDDGDIDRIVDASRALGNEVHQEYGRLVTEVTRQCRDMQQKLSSAAASADTLIQTGSQTLRNFRSVWEEFTAPGMGLNRHTVAMIVRTDWKDVEQRLSITPCIARVKQFGKDLEGLGLALPVTALTDRLLPAAAEWGGMPKALLSRFDFSNLFSDLGGMRFDELFPGFKMPEFARDKLRITHSFDRQAASAWIKAEADIRIPGRKKLLSIGPVTVELEDGHFTGEIRFEGALEGKLTRTNAGQLTGSWHMSVAGTELMIFKEAAVRFSNGKLDFDFSPDRMEMPGLLKMLTDATKNITGGADDDGGEDNQVFKVGLVKVREVPVGVRAALDIPPISVGGGTTAITNLSLGGHFELKALNDLLRPQFLLGLGFYLGKREAPFNLTVFILGGGGHVSCDLTFEPKKGLGVDFVMSIHASATLAIAAGWITGLVSIMAGLEGEYHKPATNGSVYVTIYVRIIGTVELVRIVSIFLVLSLEATYKSFPGGGEELLGTGFVRAEIRICRFFKIKVAKSYSKRFAGSGGGSSRSLRAAAANKAEQSIEAKAFHILRSLA